AEEGVGLVDHHRHRPQGLEQVEDLLQVRLGHALPLAAEVEELHARHADVPGEAVDQERLAGPHRSRDQVAHGHHVELAALEGVASPGSRLAGAGPATEASGCAGSMTSRRPWRSAWMISLFFALRSSGVMRTPSSRASVSRRSRFRRERPAVIFASTARETSL